jgi:adenylosuccinate lyase
MMRAAVDSFPSLPQTVEAVEYDGAAGSMPALAPGECHAGLEQARSLGLASSGKTTWVASEAHAARYGSQVAIGAQMRSPQALPPRGATSWGDDKVVASMWSRG